MTVLFTEGFDHYNTEAYLLKKWTGEKTESGTLTTLVGSDYGRRGSGGARVNLEA